MHDENLLTSMTQFEKRYLVIEPFTLPLYQIVKKRLSRYSQLSDTRPEILDVGGRRSHYTIGIDAEVTVSDIRRETKQQRALNLGLTDGTIEETRERRSNIKSIVIDDMTASSLSDASFDCIVAVEVLEHIEDDEAFLKNVFRVLKPNGLFLMTTPNGDFVENTNPDHKRHYRAKELRSRLETFFSSVSVHYGIKSGRIRTLGLAPWSLKSPIRTITSMACNRFNMLQSNRKRLQLKSNGTQHLFAEATK